MALFIFGAMATAVELERDRAGRESREDALHALPVADIRVRSLDGELWPLAPTGGGYVLVVSSTDSCCALTVQRLANAAHGRTLRQLYVVDLNSAAAADSLLRATVPALNAVALGPAPRSDLERELQVTSLPFLILVDQRGRVVRWHSGGLSAKDAESVVQDLLPS